MLPVGNFLVSRGTDYVQARLQQRDQSHKADWLSLLIFTFTIFTGTALMVASLTDQDLDNYLNVGNTEGPDKPVTDSITTNAGLQSTIKQMRARGGLWSCFRGFRMFLAFAAGSIAMSTFLTFAALTPVTPYVRLPVGVLISYMIFATWQMAWIHLVIADKSPKRSYWRMLGYRHWLKIAPVIALYSATNCMSFSYPMSVSQMSHSGTIPEPKGPREFLKTFAGDMMPAFICFIISLPVSAVFTRVAASMLPEEDYPIVQFDRTFNGKVKSEAKGDSGKLSIKDAWTTFEWSARIRYVKIVLKASVTLVILQVAVMILIMGELAFCL